MEKGNPLALLLGNINCYRLYREQYGSSLKTKSRAIIRTNNSIYRHVIWRKPRIWKETWSIVLNAALFTIARTWEQPKCPHHCIRQNFFSFLWLGDIPLYVYICVYIHIYQFSHSVMSDSLQPMDCSMSGLPVHHQLLELAQTHVHWVSGAIQPSHPLSSPSPPTFSLWQNQSFPMSQLFASGDQSIGASASASVLPMNIQDWSPLGWICQISL